MTAESILNHTAPFTNYFQKCQEWDYDQSEVGSTIISEWNLVCDRASLTSLAEVVFLVGVGVGGVIGGWISDRYAKLVQITLQGLTLALIITSAMFMGLSEPLHNPLM